MDTASFAFRQLIIVIKKGEKFIVIKVSLLTYIVFIMVVMIFTQIVSRLWFLKYNYGENQVIVVYNN